MKKCDICGKTCPSTSTDIDQYDHDDRVDASNADDLIHDFCEPCDELFLEVLDARLSKAANFAEIKAEVVRRQESS